MAITPETPEKDEFAKLSVKSKAKHEIDIIAATERRFVYEVVEDMLKLYKAVTKKSKRVTKSSNGKNAKPASMAIEHKVFSQ